VAGALERPHGITLSLNRPYRVLEGGLVSLGKGYAVGTASIRWQTCGRPSYSSLCGRSEAWSASGPRLPPPLTPCQERNTALNTGMSRSGSR